MVYDNHDDKLNAASLRHCKAIIEYPSTWLYKIIGLDPERLRSAVEELVDHDDWDLTFSNTSKGGKYICLNLQMTVTSEEERTHYYSSFKRHQDVIMVL